MSFKHPDFLFLLFAILIPIIIHLFNFRRYKKLWFSNIEFLKNITTQTRKQNQLKHLLVLFSRILAIVCIVFAFSVPEFGKKNNLEFQNQNLTAIYLDNSFSMMAEGEEGRLFDEAAEVAREVVKQAPRDQQFVFFNNQNSTTGRLLNKEEIQSEIDAQTIAPANLDISSVVNAAKRVLSEKKLPEIELYLLSDFQKNSFNTTSFPTDSTNQYFFVPFTPTQKRNIFIDSCWISQPVLLPGKQLSLTIRVRNASDLDLEKIPLKLSINDQQKAVAAIDIPALSFEDLSVTITPNTTGWQRGLIEIEDFPVTFDDKFYFTFFVSQSINVLELFHEKPSSVLKQFYSSDSIFNFQSVNYRQLNYNYFNDYRLIILNSLPAISSGLVNQLKKYMKNGGTVLFVPDKGPELANNNSFLNFFESGRIVNFDTIQSRIVSIKKNHELFRNIILNVPENADLPVLNGHFIYKYSIASGLRSLVNNLDGSDFLLTKKVGNGQLFLLSVPLDPQFGNFTQNALFVPVMYGIATQQEVVKRMAYTIGRDRNLATEISALVLSDSPYLLQSTSDEYSFIPEQKVVSSKLVLDVHEGINQAGFYKLVLNDSVYHVFGFNFNRQESMMDFYTADELNDIRSQLNLKNCLVIEGAQKGYSEVLGSIQKESELWKLFIIFALLFLLAEVLILRLWK